VPDRRVCRRCQRIVDRRAHSANFVPAVRGTVLPGCASPALSV
jgi:hypothetical protein